jgi:hypothetical protein
LTEKTARRWLAEKRIKPAELLCLVATATDPALGMCRDHAIGWLIAGLALLLRSVETRCAVGVGTLAPG